MATLYANGKEYLRYQKTVEREDETAEWEKVVYACFENGWILHKRTVKFRDQVKPYSWGWKRWKKVNAKNPETFQAIKNWFMKNGFELVGESK